MNSLPDYVVDTDSLDKFKTLIDEFWFYSVINQNYLEPEADHRSRFRDTDIEVQAPESVFCLCYGLISAVFCPYGRFPSSLTPS